MNLRSLDLNLLVVFDAIFAEKNITRAGTRVGLSQPAVSNALARLRGHLGDELFLRGPDGLRPTPRAIELAGPVHAMLVDLENVLDPSSFDPATASRAFTVAAVDYFSVVVAPKLAVHLASRAPGIDVRIVPTAGHALELLDKAEIDVATASFSDPPERFGRMTLVEDSYSCLVAKGHPLAERPVTLQRFAAARHLLVTPRGDARGFVDDRLAEKGLTRRVVMTVNHFSAAPGIVVASDLVLTAPTKIIERYLVDGMVMLPAPVEPPPVFRRLDMVWHERLARHPAHVWFRETLQTVAAAC